MAPPCRSTGAIASKGGRPAREARVAWAAEERGLQPAGPGAKRKDAEPLVVWAERSGGPAPPPGQPALEWVLLSSLPTAGEGELRPRRDWQALRWGVAAEYHKVEKAGCGDEALRFETAEALPPLPPLPPLLALGAVRVLQLRAAERAQPGERASGVAPAEEIAVGAALSGGRVGAAPMPVRQCVQEVARLGGFRGRRGDGSPGWRGLWRGYPRFQALVAGARSAATQPPGAWCRPPPDG
jgi:hypothetical protein